MEKEIDYTQLKKIGFVLVTLALLVYGFITLKNSAGFGLDAADNYLRTKMDGYMDTDSYLALVDGYILSNIVLGSISLGFGLVFCGIYLVRYLRKSN